MPIVASAATGKLMSPSTGLSPWQRTLVYDTIKTNTDTTNNLDSCFVYQHKDHKPVETSGFSHSTTTWSIFSPAHSSVDINSVNTIMSFSYFANCDKNCPEHSAVGGKITKLVFVLDNEPTDVSC